MTHQTFISDVGRAKRENGVFTFPSRGANIGSIPRGLPRGTFIFIGRSGGGKGTQANLLSEYLRRDNPKTEVFYMYTGKEFRSFIEGDNVSYAQMLSREIYDVGGRQPDFLAVYMWGHVLARQFKGTEHLIFDGSPRSLNEAQILDTALQFFKRERAHVIVINVSRKWSVERLLSRGRSDDTLEEINKRLDWYDNDVLPAVEYYRDNPQHIFCEINGEQTIEEVYSDIIEKVFHSR